MHLVIANEAATNDYPAYMITINKTISIPDDEITITASRSSGPGGQHVNKVATKITLRFNIRKTTCFTDDQKARILKKLKNIINKEGSIVMHEETRRSQAANRTRIIEKFTAMISRSLTVPKKRVPTRVTRAQKNRRLEEKKYRSVIKKYRGKNTGPE